MGQSSATSNGARPLLCFQIASRRLPRRGIKANSRLRSSLAIAAAVRRPEAVAGASPNEPRCLLRQWRHERSGRGRRGDHFGLVEWPNRRSDHQAQARQTTNVRPRKTRSPPGSRRRASIAQLHQKCVRATIGCRSGVPFACRLTALIGGEHDQIHVLAIFEKALGPEHPPFARESLEARRSLCPLRASR